MDLILFSIILLWKPVKNEYFSKYSNIMKTTRQWSEKMELEKVINYGIFFRNCKMKRGPFWVLLTFFLGVGKNCFYDQLSGDWKIIFCSFMVDGQVHAKSDYGGIKMKLIWWSFFKNFFDSCSKESFWSFYQKRRHFLAPTASVSTELARNRQTNYIKRKYLLSL